MTNELETRPIGSLLIKYSTPTVAAMVVNSIYNVVDRMFIGNYVGEDALGGLTIAFPIMMLLFAIGNIVGIGGSALMSIRLGERNKKEAEKIAGINITLAFIISMVFLTLMTPNLDFIISIFSNSKNLFPYAKDYLFIILIGFIFQMYSFLFSNMIRVQGRPYLPMFVMIVSAVTNIVLDYFFIVEIKMGVQGAAIATVIGQAVGFFISLYYIGKDKSLIRIHLKNLKPNYRIISNIFSIGMASFVATIGTSISMVFLNNGLYKYGGDAAVTSMGAINSIYTMCIMPILGIQQSMQPILGYNYGAKRMDRVFRTLTLSTITLIVFTTTVFLAIYITPETFIEMFIDSNSPIMEGAIVGLKIFTLSLPIIGINFIGVTYCQSTNQGRKSIILSMLRQFIFLIPLTIILPLYFGLSGVWMATPIADFVATIVVGFVLLKEIFDYKNSIGDYNES
ncbi:MAG: MATE family efflux transporter [Lachnospirales bacterium]